MSENKQNSPKLFTEFESPTRDEWVEATVKSLKGKPFEKLIKKTYEGFEIQPMYRAEDIANISYKDTLPGQFPYVRGTDTGGYLSQPWLIAQEINIDNTIELNKALRHDLERGQTAINVKFNFPTYIRVDTFQTLFSEVDLEKYPLYIRADSQASEFTSVLVAYLKLSDNSLEKIQGNIGYDPVHYLGEYGDFGGVSESEIFDRMATLTTWVSQNMPAFESIAVRTESYHRAGANAVQELAIAMATGVTYLVEMLERGLDIDLVAQKIRFFLTIGENFFLEIAKLRAVKMMWAKIVQEFGGNAESQKINLHASTGKRNKTRNDPYVNMLRVTTEAMAGAMGGVESMSVAPFDECFGEPDEFSRRIARNIQLILQDEVNLTNLIDPAGGSWYVEALTHELAQSAWALFQEIEATRWNNTISKRWNATKQNRCHCKTTNGKYLNTERYISRTEYVSES